MKKTCYAIIFGLLCMTSFSCRDDDDDTKKTEVCIDSDKIDEHAMCPAIISYVCGCDGKTYDNDCEAQAHGVLKWTEGSCQ
jgi:hypothetical protein